jgi:hypothetical protein
MIVPLAPHGLSVVGSMTATQLAMTFVRTDWICTSSARRSAIETDGNVAELAGPITSLADADGVTFG